MSIYVSNSECRLLVAKENAAHVKTNILEIFEDEGVSIRYAKQSVGMIRERCECAYFEEEDCDE